MISKPQTVLCTDVYFLSFTSPPVPWEWRLSTQPYISAGLHSRDPSPEWVVCCLNYWVHTVWDCGLYCCVSQFGSEVDQFPGFIPNINSVTTERISRDSTWTIPLDGHLWLPYFLVDCIIWHLCSLSSHPGGQVMLVLTVVRSQSCSTIIMYPVTGHGSNEATGEWLKNSPCNV